MATLDTIIGRFRQSDRNTRLETLLDYSRKLPELPAEHVALRDQGLNRVPECQTPVYLWVGVDGGTARVVADVPRESPTVRGFVALLIKLVDGSPATDVGRIPNDLLDQLQLTETLGMMRTQGLSAILGRVKHTVAAAALQDASP